MPEQISIMYTHFPILLSNPGYRIISCKFKISGLNNIMIKNKLAVNFGVVDRSMQLHRTIHILINIVEKNQEDSHKNKKNAATKRTENKPNY